MSRAAPRPRLRQARPIVLTIAVLALLAGATVTVVWLLGAGAVPLSLAGRRERPPAPTSSPAQSASPSVRASRLVPSEYPGAGPGTWRYAGTRGPVFGSGGPIRTYRVAVETGVPDDVEDFTEDVDGVLGDPRSWTAGGQFRLQRVPGSSPAEFTIYLATRLTSQRMCQDGGVNTAGYTSCRTPGRVIINLDRWFTAVPEYVGAGMPLKAYRDYVINHETGHQFGYGHERCPGAGRPAPVMEQQTLGLHGCTPNAWPYLDGKRYAGPQGSY